jgi:hypothetical protein
MQSKNCTPFWLSLAISSMAANRLRPETVSDTVFSVDESTVRVKHREFGFCYSILLVLGNDEDIISDHSAPDPDRAGFCVAMDAFDPCVVEEEVQPLDSLIADVLTSSLDSGNSLGLMVSAVFKIGGDLLSVDVVGEDRKKRQFNIKITEVQK